MGKVTSDSRETALLLFNGPIEIGLRTLVILSEAFPTHYSLERLVAFDYLVVHSDDVADGPPSLHPATPFRSGEILVRRNAIQQGLALYQSRGLVDISFQPSGIFYAATEQSAAFIDAVETDYLAKLRNRAIWLVKTRGSHSDSQIRDEVRENLGQWGVEFVFDSILWTEEEQ